MIMILIRILMRMMGWDREKGRFVEKEMGSPFLLDIENFSSHIISIHKFNRLVSHFDL